MLEVLSVSTRIFLSLVFLLLCPYSQYWRGFKKIKYWSNISKWEANWILNWFIVGAAIDQRLRVFKPARLLLFRCSLFGARCSSLLGGTVARCRTDAPTSSRGAAAAGLSGCERDDAPGCGGAVPASDRPAAGHARQQVRDAAADQAKPSGELPVRRRLERT